MEKAGKYEFVRKIGIGGYGVVYEGRDPFIKRRVAIKACTAEDEETRSRFYTEAEISGNLEHRNITTVHDFGVEDGVPYLVQEYLTGEDLDHLIERNEEMTFERKLDILAQVSEGMSYAHEQSVIHRDIKPGNIRLLEDGRVKIMDFGIAKLKQNTSRLTRTGTTVGTAHYLPPEQIRGEPTDHRADIFSFGVLAYELFTYRRPFDAATLAALLYKIIGEEPRPLRELWPGATDRMVNLVHRCLEKDPAHRWPSFTEIAAEIAAAKIEARPGARDSQPRLAIPTEAAAALADLDSSEWLEPPHVEHVDPELLAGLEAEVSDALSLGDVNAAELAVLRARHGSGAIPLRSGVVDRLLGEISRVRLHRDVERQRGERVDDLLARARSLWAIGDYLEARRLLRALLDLNPGQSDAVQLLAATEAQIAGAPEPGAVVEGLDEPPLDAALPEARRAGRLFAVAPAGREMDPFAGVPLLQALRRLRSTPGATIEVDGSTKIYLRYGELFLEAGDPLAADMTASALPDRVHAWLRRFDEWGLADVKVDPSPPSASLTLTAGVLLAPLLMDTAERGVTGELELRLISADLHLVSAATAQDLVRASGLEPLDAFLLTRLEKPQSWDTLVGLAGLPRGEVVRRIARLSALGWLRAVEPGKTVAETAGETLSNLLASRILADLEDKPLRVNPSEHRARLRDLLGTFGGLTHYELLGLDPRAEASKVHPAFVELARLTHPHHAERLGLHAAGPAMQMLFDRASAAYEVLSDPRRRAHYDVEMGVFAIPKELSSEDRAAERRKLARGYFEQAQARVALEDFHFATELMRQAVRADPKPEYHKLLAACLMRNPHWLGQARDSARQAQRLRPSDVDARVMLGAIHEQLGEIDAAAEQYQEALARDPGLVAAQEGMQRVLTTVAEQSKPKAAGKSAPAAPVRRVRRPH